jgi:hypothetical protein
VRSTGNKFKLFQLHHTSWLGCQNKHSVCCCRCCCCWKQSGTWLAALSRNCVVQHPYCAALALPALHGSQLVACANLFTASTTVIYICVSTIAAPLPPAACCGWLHRQQQ